MHVTVDTTEGFNRRMRVEIPEDRVAGMVNERLESLIPTTVMPGFRPGKVPLKLIAHRYGARIRNDVVGQLVPETFQQAAVQEKLILASDPTFTEVSADPGKGLTYTVAFDVYPDLQLPPMETLEIQRPVAEVTEEDVDRTIEALRKQHRRWSVVDRPAEQGDRVVVDFEGVVGARPAEGSDPESADESAVEAELDDIGRPEGGPAEVSPAETLKATGVSVELGEGRMLAGFEDGLIGAKADDERVLVLEYPEKYYKPELSGRPVTFTVRMRSVEAPDPPESDEAFVGHFGIEDGNMDAFRAATRQDLTSKLVLALRIKTDQRVIGALLKAIGPVELPRSAIEKEAATIAEKKRQEFKRLGIEPDSLGISPAKSEPQAERQLVIGLLLGRLMTLSELTVDRDKVRERIEAIAAGYQEPKQVIAWYYENQQRLVPVESAVLQSQVMEWVLERANVTEEPMSLVEALK